MLFWILVVLQIVTGIVAGEAAIRKTPEGASTLQTLSKAGYFFLQWRAFADYKRELFGLQRIFAVAAIIFAVMFFALGKTVINTPFAILPALFTFLWMAMKFGTDFRKSVREQLSMAAIMVIGPWTIYLLDYLTDFQFHQIRLIVSPLAPLGVLQLPDLLITAMLSGIGLVGGLLMAGFAIVVFSIVPLFFLFLMAGSSTISRRALTVSPKAAYNAAALYFFLVGPILIALENKGVI